MHTRSIRVLVAEDFERFRQFFRSALGGRADLQVVCEVSDGMDAVRKARELQPDLVLLDIGLPKLNGIEAAKTIHEVCPTTKILFVSQELAPEVVRRALGTGASGYVVKLDAAKELLEAVNAVLRGERFVSRRLVSQALAHRRDSYSLDNAAVPDLGLRVPALQYVGDFRDFLGDVLDAAIVIGRADFGSIQTCNPQNADLRICVQRGFSGEFLEFFDRLHAGQDFSGSALKTLGRLTVEDVTKSALFSDVCVIEAMLRADVRAWQSTPLLDSSRRAIGMLSTHYRTPHVFSDETLNHLDAVAVRAGQVIERWHEEHGR